MNYLPSKNFKYLILALALGFGLIWLASSFGAQGDTWEARGSQFKAELQGSTDENVRNFLNGIGGSPSQELGYTKPSLTDNYLKTLSNFFTSRIASDGTISRDSLELSDGAEKLIVHGLANDAKTHLAQTTYDQNDVAPDNSRSPRDYFNALGPILEKTFSPTENNTRNALFQDFGTYIKRKKTTDESYLTIQSRMRLQEVKFETGEKELKDIHPPQSLIELHVQLLNLYANSALSFKQLALFEEDPLVGYVGAINYNKNVEIGITILRSVKNLLATNTIHFSDNEPGVFLQYLTSGL